MLDVSIVIVSYNSAALLQKCVEKIIASNAKCSFEIIVVDNNSNDDSLSALSSFASKVIWIQNDENVGFARAVNKGVKNAKGENILILNPDAFFVNNVLDLMLENATKQSHDLNIQTGILFNEDGSLQKNTYTYNASFGELISYNILVNYFCRKKKENQEIRALHGACLFMRATTFNALGGFDEDFFLYSEEFELCHRLIKKGGRLSVNQQAKIIHVQEASSPNASWNERQRLASIGLLFYKVHGFFGFLLFWEILWFNLLCNFLLLWKMDGAYRTDYFKSAAHVLRNNFIFSKIFFRAYQKPFKI